MSRPIHEIAAEIVADWSPNIWFGAEPYVRAMLELDSIDDNYDEDSARTVVSYFLGNAKTWRGETARRVKAELRALLGR